MTLQPSPLQRPNDPWLNELDQKSPLACETSSQWIQAVLSQFNLFLIDHAACERKASASCLSFVVKYRDKAELVDAMVGMAREELEHFHRLVKILNERGLQAGGDERTPYINEMLSWVRNEERLLDRLLVSSLTEARGAERFQLVAQNLEPGALKNFYTELALCETRHYLFYLKLAGHYFSKEQVSLRFENLRIFESELVSRLEVRPSLY